MDLGAGIAAATQAIAIAKSLRGIEKNYDAASYKAQMAELINSLTDAKLALADAKEEISEQTKEINRLKASFLEKSVLIKGDGDYSYKTDEQGAPLGYPICPKCEQVDGRIVQLKQDIYYQVGRCPACSSTYNPVTCYLPRGNGGPATKADQVKLERDAENARIEASLDRSGNALL